MQKTCTLCTLCADLMHIVSTLFFKSVHMAHYAHLTRFCTVCNYLACTLCTLLIWCAKSAQCFKSSQANLAKTPSNPRFRPDAHFMQNVCTPSTDINTLNAVFDCTLLDMHSIRACARCSSSQLSDLASHAARRGSVTGTVRHSLRIQVTVVYRHGDSTVTG